MLCFNWLLNDTGYQGKDRKVLPPLQVICLGNPEAVALAEEAVKQVASIHREYDLKRFHIGADEAFQVFVFITEALKSYVYEKCEQNCILKIIVFGHLMVRIFYLFSFFWNL